VRDTQPEGTMRPMPDKLATVKACAECHEEVERKGFPPARPDCRFCVHDYRLALIEEREAWEKAEARVVELEGAAAADEQRLIAAAEKAGIGFGGCDTPDDLAEAAVDLAETAVDLRVSQRRTEASLAAYREALDQAVKQLCAMCGDKDCDLGDNWRECGAYERLAAMAPSPDPARGVAERLAAGARLADLIRSTTNYPVEFYEALADWDKAVGRDA